MDSKLWVSIDAIVVLNQVEVLGSAILGGSGNAIQGRVCSRLVIVTGEKNPLVRNALVAVLANAFKPIK